MTILEMILIVMIAVIWTSLGVTMLIDSIQSLVFDRKCEKREIEYHKQRMNSLK